MKRINIKGPIIGNDDQWIYDWLELEATSPKTVNEALPETNEDVEVLINSGGGDVYAGSEIYTTLRDYPGKVTVKVVGIAASAASVIAMAGDNVQMSPTAQMMIHNVSTVTAGDHVDHEKMSEILSGHDKSIANAYTLRTNKSIEEVLDLMADETWMSAEDAVENGFADEVMFKNEGPQLVASVTPTLSQGVIDKLRATKQQEETKTINVDVDEIAGSIEEIIESKFNELTEEVSEKQNKTDDEPPKKLGRFIF